MIAALLLCSLVLLAAAAPAIAQARDPFRPPGGTSVVPGDTAGPPATGGDDGTPPGTGGLPRTGQDILLLIATAAAFLAAGGALRLTGRVVAT